MDVMQHSSNTPAVINKPHLARKIRIKLSESCTVFKSSYKYVFR